MRRIKERVIGLCLTMVLAMTAVAAAMPPILKLGDVAQGMKGKAYTVVDSSGQIRSFDVDLVGVVGQGKGAQKMIMAKASGPVVQSVGGILQGMSGSPVYVDGKLVGAVAMGLKEMTPYTFFIRPIEDMMDLWKLPDSKDKTWIQQVDIKKAAEQRAAAKKAADQAIADLAKRKGDKDKVIPEKGARLLKKETIKTDKQPDKVEKASLYAAGFSDSGLAFLQKKFSPFGIQFSNAGGFSTGPEGSVVYQANLQPGSSVGVAVVYGDFSVGATGTVTAVDGRRILGFGHPFMHKGNSNYFMTDATVVGTISGPTAGTKVATVDHIIGRINQDRDAGISGVVGEFPSVVPMKVHVKDNTLSRDTNYSAQIAYDEDFLPAMSASIAYAALNKTMDTLAESTANVHFVIRTDAADGGKIERSNMFYNLSDVGQVAVNELGQAMNLICSNPEKESNILDVKVDISVDNGRKTASILSAVPDKKKVKPGDTVQFQTTIKPYRQDKETLLISYTVPKNQRPGILNLDFRGGGLLPAYQLLLAQQEAAAGLNLAGEEDKLQSTAEKLRALQSLDRNNEIIVSPASGSFGGNMTRVPAEKTPAATDEDTGEEEMAASTLLTKPSLGQKKNTGNPLKTRFATKYIIDNVIHTTLQIEKK